MDALPNQAQSTAISANLRFHEMPAPPQDEVQELLQGLREDQPRLSPRFFYDERGSKLFDRITQTPEYYPTRTEKQILATHLADMMAAAGNAAVLVEPGSGNCEKAAPFIRDHEVRHYVPIEISGDFLVASCQRLMERFPDLSVDAVCADFTRCGRLPEAIPAKRRLLFFPGSTIGNFDPRQAQILLRRFAGLVGPGGHLLIGVDLKKETALLNAAYNDAERLTEAFNLNVLRHLNRRFHCDFQLADFAHRAFYNESLGRVEMHLEATRDTAVHIDGQRLVFSRNQTIHTENSWKYTLDEFKALADSAGLANRSVWTDDRAQFSVHLLQAGH